MSNQPAPSTDPGPEQKGPGSTSHHGRALSRYWWVGGLAIAALIVIVLAPLASSDPDGLDSVAEQHGFIAQATDWFYHLIPDYTFPGIGGSLSTIIAGLVGVGLVFAAVMLIGRLLARRRSDRS